MVLILASMSGLNSLTEHTSTPKIRCDLFPWPPPLTMLSFLSAEIASVFFTGQEVPHWQYKKGLGFNFILAVVASMDMFLWVECGNLVNKMLSQYHKHLFATRKNSYTSNQTLKVTITKYADKSNKIKGSGKGRAYKVHFSFSFFFLPVRNSSIPKSSAT